MQVKLSRSNEKVLRELVKTTFRSVTQEVNRALQQWLEELHAGKQQQTKGTK